MTSIVAVVVVVVVDDDDADAAGELDELRAKSAVMARTRANERTCAGAGAVAFVSNAHKARARPA